MVLPRGPVASVAVVADIACPLAVGVDGELPPAPGPLPVPLSPDITRAARSTLPAQPGVDLVHVLNVAGHRPLLSSGGSDSRLVLARRVDVADRSCSSAEFSDRRHRASGP